MLFLEIQHPLGLLPICILGSQIVFKRSERDLAVTIIFGTSSLTLSHSQLLLLFLNKLVLSPISSADF